MRLDSNLADKVDSQPNMEGEIGTFMVEYLEWDNKYCVSWRNDTDIYNIDLRILFPLHMVKIMSEFIVLS